MNLTRINKKNLFTFVLYCIVVELIMGGSGQIIHVVGGLTLRMVLFGVGMILTLFMVGYKGIDKQAFKIFASFLVLLMVSTAISLINDGQDLLFEDVKPRIFILIFPFLYWTITSLKNIETITNIIRVGTLVMSVIYLVYLILIKALGLIDFVSFYASMGEESDFMFRGNGGELFYKGFVFLPVGLIFWLQKKKIIPSVILAVAILFTLTRGFYVITVVGVLFYYILYPKFSPDRFLLSVLVVLAMGAALFLVDINSFVGDRSEGDVIRVVTFQQVLENTNVLSFLIGHGMGNGVPIRPLHMENAFLEIFYKQGLLGLLYWLYFLFYLTKDYWKSRQCEYSAVYYISSLMIYIQSLFNPYITNPIGMMMVILGYIICHYYSNNLSPAYENTPGNCNI